MRPSWTLEELLTVCQQSSAWKPQERLGFQGSVSSPAGQEAGPGGRAGQGGAAGSWVGPVLGWLRGGRRGEEVRAEGRGAPSQRRVM